MEAKRLFPHFLAIVVALLFGCITQPDRAGTAKRDVVNSPAPPPDDYILLDVPDFAARANPDADGRKFRIAYLSVFAKECQNINDARRINQQTADTIADPYLMCRKQAADSPITQFWGNSNKAGFQYFKSIVRTNRTLIPYHVSDGTIPRRCSQFFAGYPSDRWLKQVNEELERRFPNLFSASLHAFPLDVILAFAYEPSKRPSAGTACEAWLLGLPKHGNIADMAALKAGVPVTRAFADPYNAIAGSLFAVPPSELSAIQPANPDDHQ